MEREMRVVAIIAICWWFMLYEIRPLEVKGVWSKQGPFDSCVICERVREGMMFIDRGSKSTFCWEVK
jgi:hypothetical protein